MDMDEGKLNKPQASFITACGVIFYIAKSGSSKEAFTVEQKAVPDESEAFRHPQAKG